MTTQILDAKTARLNQLKSHTYATLKKINALGDRRAMIIKETADTLSFTIATLQNTITIDLQLDNKWVSFGSFNAHVWEYVTGERTFHLGEWVVDSLDDAVDMLDYFGIDYKLGSMIGKNK